MKLFLLVAAIAVAALVAVFVAFFRIGPAAPFLMAAILCFLALLRMTVPARLAVVVLALSLLAPGLAFAASIDVGQALNGSLQEIINGVVTAAITAVVTWLAYLAKSKFNIDIEARHREALTAFLQRQASGLVAQGAVKLQGIRVEVQSQALADAANQALSMIPGALTFFGLTPQRLQGMIVDLIPKQPAVAQAQAVAIDVANPATPSK